MQMHQDAFDLLSEGVLWLDEGGRVQYTNERAAKLLGYQRNALLRTSYFEIDPHYSLLRWRRLWNRLQESQASERLETEYVNREGKLFGVRGRIGLDLYSIDPELCLIVFEPTDANRREADLLEVVQREGNIGGWEYSFINDQVFLTLPVRRWLKLPADRSTYSGEEFRRTVAALIETDYEQARAVYKRLQTGTSEADLTITISGARYELHARSLENEFEVAKIYGSLRLPRRAEEEGTQRANTTGTTVVGKLLRRALDHQDDAVYLVSLKSNTIIYANDTACRLSGYSRRELLGMPSNQLARPQDNFENVAENLAKHSYLEFSTYTLAKDGAEVPVYAKLYLQQEIDERYILIISRDERHRAATESDLLLYQKTIDTLHEWVIWLDASHRIVLLNEAGRRKLRRKTSLDPEGQRLKELMPDLAVPSVEDVRQEQADGRSRPATTYIYSTAGGDDRTLQIRFSRVATEAQSYLCVICRDVTLQQANRRKLQQAKQRVEELTQELKTENENLREQVEQFGASDTIITVSPKYQKILAQIAQVADTDATVLVTGETGTGKELLAQSIHKFSRRNAKPLVSVNCAALPESLIESELFGHERGAFTGAVGQKKGKFELAHEGTIFLDEIGELPLDMQAKLLRILQEGEIQRIGSTAPIHVDVRIVAATNRDLERMIGEGRFREDLFYRLNVFPIHNPPLRERAEDIPVLVKHFTKVYAERMGRNVTHINPKDLEQLSRYDFPGNVRELINLVERAVITTTGTTLNLDASLRALRRPTTNGTGLRTDRLLPFEEMQKQHIIEALQRTKGKVTGPGGAAELLDLNGRTLMSKMNKLGIDRNKYTG